jgi:hypothetical protein
VGDYSKVAAAVAVNTTIGAAAGTIATLFIAMAYQYFTLGEQRSMLCLPACPSPCPPACSPLCGCLAAAALALCVSYPSPASHLLIPCLIPV